MGWSEADWSDDVLARIVALLFALANLADRASRFPTPRRQEALGFICCGEAAARAFVIGMAGAPIETAEQPFLDDAASLAARLRVLAFVLWFLPALAPPARSRERLGTGRSAAPFLPACRRRATGKPRRRRPTPRNTGQSP